MALIDFNRLHLTDCVTSSFTNGIFQVWFRENPENSPQTSQLKNNYDRNTNDNLIFLLSLISFHTNKKVLLECGEQGANLTWAWGKHQGLESEDSEAVSELGRERSYPTVRASLVHSSEELGRMKRTLAVKSYCPLCSAGLSGQRAFAVQEGQFLLCIACRKASSCMMQGGCPKGPWPPLIAVTLKYSAARSQWHLKLSFSRFLPPPSFSSLWVFWPICC